ncbi:hypothetical protein CAEBREN_24220 [Caenorhabditis brenneri]|uniref:Uncharacterized protein n=1 Tax=Caenorhabditis brenneri TaxID=135651 RepID=G0NY50_CAEBE|nr:hypothetical protein CAEBREN_24220 [Caenorhabditis brenneri]
MLSYKSLFALLAVIGMPFALPIGGDTGSGSHAPTVRELAQSINQTHIFPNICGLPNTPPPIFEHLFCDELLFHALREAFDENYVPRASSVRTLPPLPVTLPPIPILPSV